MKTYIAVLPDRFAHRVVMFKAIGEKIIKAPSYAKWARGMKVGYVKKRYHETGAAFYEVARGS